MQEYHILQGLKYNCQEYAWKIQLVDPVDCNPCSSIRMLKIEDILDELSAHNNNKDKNIQKHIQPMKYSFVLTDLKHNDLSVTTAN
jgi:hypothetical protein